MIYIDDRIVRKDEGIFNALIGKNLESICHDPFGYTNSVYGIAGIKVEDTFYKVSNKIEVRDYFGKKEDVAVFKISEDIPENIHSLIEDSSMITAEINQKIKYIDVARFLDDLLGFCGDERFLKLFKQVCRHYYYKYPEEITFQVSCYFEWYQSDEEEN